MKISGLSIGLKTVIAVGAIGLSSAAVSAGAVLPSHANEHAKDAVTQETPNERANEHANDADHEATPNEHASFGQCVAANAKTASEHKADHAKGADGWNPTQGCDKPGGDDQEGPDEEQGSDKVTGLENANDHADDAAEQGLEHAEAGSDNASGNTP